MSWIRLRMGASLATALLVVAGCAPAAQAPQPTGGQAPGQPAKPPVDQKLTIGQASITPTMMPYISICCTQRRYDIFDMIVGQKADGSVEPMVATSWKVVNDTTWEFTIRQDLKFHDGSSLTADDVVFSITRSIDPEKKYAITNRLQTIQGATRKDAATVVVTTTGPDPILLKRAALISVLPKAYLERVGDAEFANQPIGSGPFKLKEYIPENRVVVVATEHPFRKSQAITEVTIKSVPEPSTRVAGLKTGELDWADAIPIDQAEGLKSLGLQIISIDAGSSTGYWMDTVIRDQPKTGPIGNKLVRQALNYAIDKDPIVKNIYRGFTKVEQGQPIQPETFGYHPGLKPYPYDPAKAKQLLAQAGYANGFKLTLAVLMSGAEATAQHLFVQDQLKQIGVELEITPLGEYANFRDMFYGDKTRSDLFAPGLINTPAMDADFSLVWFSSTQPLGSRHYNNPEFDKYYLASTTEMNEQKRKELIGKALEVMLEDPPWLYMLQSTLLIAYNAKVKGMERRTDREQRYDRLSIG